MDADHPDESHCDCAYHGRQRITFVCAHITGVPRGETVGFVSAQPEDLNDLRDAWCDECDAYLAAHGGEWTDEVAPPAGLSILCAECYRARLADAERANRRTIHSF